MTPAAPAECSGCGLLHHVPALEPGLTAVCERCGTVLRRANAEPFTRPLALTAAALVLMAILCSTTLLTVETAGITLHAGLFSGPEELARRGLSGLALVVLLTVFVLPVARMLGLTYVLLRLREARPAPHLRRIFVWTTRLRPWSMVDVFVFGVFVAYVKLGDLVTLHPGAGTYALLGLTLVLIWGDTTLDREAIWRRLAPTETAAAAAGTRGLIGCETCGLVQESAGHGACRRCASALHARKPESLGRTWALLIAGIILYVPANLYPVLTVVQLGAGAPSTIFGGVRELLLAGQYPLAALVFFASIAVPMLKMLGLAVMLVSTQTARRWALRDRTRLYHFVQWVGRWSMIDIFMEALLGALIRFGAVATIEPGLGAVAFCAVVLLTMFAAECFDPRLMWDAARVPRAGTLDTAPHGTVSTRPA